jgi:hypothetical protein
MFIWGVIMTCTGFIHNFGSLVAIRFLLGLFEFVLPCTYGLVVLS